MKRYIRASRSLSERYDSDKIQEKFKDAELLEYQDIRDIQHEWIAQGMPSDGIFRGCVAVVDTRNNTMEVADQHIFLFYSFDYNDYRSQCSNYPGMLIKTYFRTVRDIDDHNFEFMESDVKQALFDYLHTLSDIKRIRSLPLGVWCDLNNGADIHIKIDDSVDDVTLFNKTPDGLRYEIAVPSDVADGKYNFDVIDRAIESSKLGAKQLRKLKKQFKSSEVLDWAMSTVNDSDPGWKLDTPKKFGQACLDLIWDNLDKVSSMVGRTISDEELDVLSDWILDECSKGDFEE